MQESAILTETHRSSLLWGKSIMADWVKRRSEPEERVKGHKTPSSEQNTATELATRAGSVRECASRQSVVN